jgi:hypothetical protein
MNPAVQEVRSELDEKKLKRAAIELVERARLRDQNAIGMIIETRKNAAKGSPRAKKALALMLAVAQGSPPQVNGAPRVGGFWSSALASLRDKVRRFRSPKEYATHVVATVPEVGSSVRDATNAAQALSWGPSIGPKVLGAVQSTVGAEDNEAAKAFAFAVVNPPEKVIATCKKCNSKIKPALQLGYTMGLAQRLQAARRGNIRALSPKAAWELT